MKKAAETKRAERYIFWQLNYQSIDIWFLTLWQSWKHMDIAGAAKKISAATILCAWYDNNYFSQCEECWTLVLLEAIRDLYSNIKEWIINIRRPKLMTNYSFECEEYISKVDLISSFPRKKIKN